MDAQEIYVTWLETYDMIMRTFYARQRRRYIARAHGRRELSRLAPRLKCSVELMLDTIEVELLTLNFN